MSGDTAAFDAMLRGVAARYRPAGQFATHYVHGKLRRDPAARALFDLAQAEDFGEVADLGCGRGQFAACLLAAGLARRVTGVECNARLLAQARLAMQGLDFAGVEYDLADPRALPAADTVMLIDVLYQLGTAAQGALLRRAAAAARQRVIIRTADPHRGLRSVVTRMLEIVFRRVWPHAGAHVNAQPTSGIIATLADGGMECSELPCWKGTPFSNVLIIARHRSPK